MSAIVPGTLYEIYWVILPNMGHIFKIADSSQLIFSLLLFLLKALMCAFFRAPIHDFVDLLIRQQFALTNNSMMTPLWMNPPVAPQLQGNLLRGIDNKSVTWWHGIQFVYIWYVRSTGKSFSEALILALVNPQYDKILFIEVMSKQKICTQHVLNLYFSRNSMNNLLSYCG